MHVELTEEQEMIRAMAREFADKEVRPIAAEIDRDARFPRETVRRMGALGLLGMTIPPAYGGSGADAVSYVVAMEEIAKACASHAVILSVNNSLYCEPVYKYGSEEQRRRLLVPFVTGEKIGCFALTEPQAGSDATNQTTLAVRAGDHYVVNGRKVFVTSGRESSAALVFCQTDRGQGHGGISVLIIESGTPGFLVPKVEEKLGLRASDTAEFLFEDCRVPVANRLGDEGLGIKIAMSSLDSGRIGIAAQAVGIARAALEDATAYARERRTFGQAIANHQAIQFKLADMATEVDAARLLTWRAATLKDKGARFTTEASMAKVFASEVANRVAKEGVQIFGGNGYVEDFPAERHFRDAKITEIYEGTSEIQRMVIANNLLKGA